MRTLPANSNTARIQRLETLMNEMAETINLLTKRLKLVYQTQQEMIQAEPEKPKIILASDLIRS